MRGGIIALLRFILRIFFRRVEVVGQAGIPAGGPLLVVLNHPNGLIDPLFILCLAPRPVSFLAKAPLFKMPVVGWFARTLDSIPVYRHQDAGSDPSKNREMFAQVRAHLGAGGAVAIFPEGTSHSDPKLKPLRTGAARIALGVASDAPLQILPAGLFYTAKDTFRSSALLCFGAPFAVASAQLDGAGEPAPDAVEALTLRIADALGHVTLQADAHDAHDLVARTERILASERRPHNAAPPPELADEFALRRRLTEGYAELSARAPERLERLRRRILHYEERLVGAGIDPWELPVGRLGILRVLAATGALMLRFLLLLPLGVPGLVLHFLPYRLIGLLARRAVGRNADVLATAKAIGAMLLLPLTWIVAGVIAGRLAGPVVGGIALLFAPASGYAALRLSELADRAAGSARALLLWLVGRQKFLHLQRERREIRAELIALADELRV
ncbi:MAG: hypothetical protein HOP28_15500 [Gemmatimonadales bacterium]|nr:hypothetical protein [Gemmatimonadales bacterium]